MKFYTFSQMNCYGAFETALERGIGLNVIIEAPNAKAANEKAREIGLSLDRGCSFCDRWTSRDEEYDDEGTIIPSAYGTPIWAHVNSWVERQTPSFIHWANGEVEKVEHREGSLNEGPDWSKVPRGWLQIHDEIQKYNRKQGAA